MSGIRTRIAVVGRVPAALALALVLLMPTVGCGPAYRANTDAGEGAAADAAADGDGCVPMRCTDLNSECDEPDDGCGRALSCGDCTGPEVCGSRIPNQCDIPPGTWLEATLDPSDGVGLESSLVVDSLGGLHVTYSDSSNADLLYMARTPGGAWSSPAILDQGGSVGYDSSLAIADNDDLHVTYLDFTSDDLKHAQRPAGAGWAKAEIADAGGKVGNASALAIDGDGVLHVTYWDWQNSDLIYVNRSASGSWGTPEPLDTDGTVGSHSALAVDSSDVLHLSYFDSSGDEINYLSRSAAGSWSSPVPIVSFISAVSSSSTSLAVDSSLGLHLSYYDSDEKSLRYIALPAGGSWTTSVRLADNASDQHSLAVDASGGVHVAYYAELVGSLRYVYRSPGGAWTSPVSVDLTTDSGADCSLALSDDGTVHITYRDSTKRHLKHAQRVP